MSDMDLFILAGYNPDRQKALKIMARLRKDLGVDYYMGNKGLIGLEEGYPMLQCIIDHYKASPNIDNIIVLGPAKEFEGKVTDCKLVDIKGGLTEKIHYILENTKGVSALTTVDTPYTSTNEISEYLDKVTLLAKDYDLIWQQVIKQRIHRGSEWKPGYHFKIDNKKYDTLPGHLKVINTDNINPRFVDLVDMFYDRKGTWILGRAFRAAFMFPKIFKHTDLLAQYMLSKAGIGAITPKRTERKLADLGLRAHIEFTNTQSFAMDVDDADKEVPHAISYLKKEYKKKVNAS